MTRVLVCGLLVMLSACSAMGLRPAPPELPLLPMEGGPAPGIVKQRITLVTARGQMDFASVVRLQPDALTGVVLLPSGQTLLSYQYAGGAVKATSALSPDLPVRDFLAMMQFGLWPEGTLRDYYSAQEKRGQETGWTLDTNGHGKRTLYWQATPVLERSVVGDHIEIRQLEADYLVRIENLNQ